MVAATELTYGRCSGCGATIIWRHTESGKLMPLDATMLMFWQQGAYVLDGPKHCRRALPMFDTEMYLTHWATCPNWAEFKPERDCY